MLLDLPPVLDRVQLDVLLDNRNRAEPVGLTTTTYPERSGLRKTGNRFYGLVKKVAERSGFVGSSYENGVNTQLAKDGLDATFKAESLWFGMGVHVGRYYVTHKTKGGLYITFRPPVNSENVVVGMGRVEYQWIASGAPLSETELAEYKTFLPVKSGKPKTQEAEKMVAWQVIDLTGLNQIRIAGETFGVNITPDQLV